MSFVLQDEIFYSTRNSAYNGLNPADFYTPDTYTTSFPDDNCGIDPEQKCNRPYKHPLQNILLSRHLVQDPCLCVKSMTFQPLQLRTANIYLLGSNKATALTKNII